MVATNRIAMRDVRSDTTRRWYARVGIGFTSLRRRTYLERFLAGENGCLRNNYWGRNGRGEEKKGSKKWRVNSNGKEKRKSARPAKQFGVQNAKLGRRALHGQEGRAPV
jgi:hypothetical protein